MNELQSIFSKSISLKNFTLALCCFFSSCNTQSEHHRKPNFILILTDDQSWVGTSFLADPSDPRSKSDYYQTPNMDDYVIKSYIVDQKNKNRFICETKSGKKMYILLRWKNGNGIAFPAFQIS